MSISIKYLLKAATKKALSNQGLKASLFPNKTFEGYRANTDSVWVGVDVKPFGQINGIESIPALIETYCVELLSMPSSDEIIWFPVFKQTGTKTAFSTTAPMGQESLNYAGFIYIDRIAFADKHKTDITNKELDVFAKQQVETELAEYAMSCDYDPYLLTVQSHNGLCRLSTVCFNVDNDIDKKAYALISESMEAIKEMGTTYRVDLDIIDMDSPTPEKIAETVIAGFQETFNATPLIGEVQYIKERNTASLYFLLDSLPDIETLSKTKGVRLISRINEETGFFGADIYDVWDENTPYSEWGTEHADAYIKGLFSFIPNMTCSYTTKHYHSKRR